MMRRGSTVRLLPKQPIKWTPSQRAALWHLGEDVPRWKFVFEIYRRSDPDCRMVVDRTQVEPCSLLDHIIRSVDES